MNDASRGARRSVEFAEILKLLPHRYPFLLVDRVIEIDGDKSCIGVKNVTANEPHFVGHFPGNPVMPGVLLLEGMAQTCGVICSLASGEGRPLRRVFFLTIDKAKFRKPVLPGDVVEYHMTQTANRKTMWWFHGEAKVRGVLVAQAEIGAMVAED
jgi:3-hydroxyacyl-[acyl-carrier-protein] dehydratase